MTNSTSVSTTTTKGFSNMNLIHNGQYRSNFDSTALVFSGETIFSFAKRAMQILAETKSAKGMFAKMAAKHQSYALSFEFNNNNWTINLPVAALVAHGQYDVKGNADLNTSDDNVVQLLVDALRVASKGDFKALKEYQVKSGVQSKVSAWVEDQINSTAAAAQRGGTGFYSKAIADWRVPAFVSVGNGRLPVVYVSAESPVFHVGNKTFTENELVLLSRSPVPFSVAAVVKVAPFHMDANVVCVNPLIMDVNHGDNDGDAVSLTSLRVNGQAVSVVQAMTFNNGEFSIGGFRRANAEAGLLSTTLEEVKAVASLRTNKKQQRKFVDKFFNIHNSVNVDEFASNVAKVQSVYSKFVGKTYDIAFNLHMEMTHRIAAGDCEFSIEEMMAAVAQAWTVYEDEALCGYSEKTFAHVSAWCEGVSEESSAFLIQARRSALDSNTDWNQTQEITGYNQFALAARASRILTKKFKSSERHLILVRRDALAAIAADLPSGSLVQAFAFAQA